MILVVTNRRTGAQSSFHHVQAVWKGESFTKSGDVVPALKFAVSETPDQWDEKVISLKGCTFDTIDIPEPCNA